MSKTSDTLRHAYIATLRAYIHAGGERALSDAYELGRCAQAHGLGVLDMALLHGSAVEQLVLAAPVADRERLAHSATDIFKELLSPFEMTFRGYREANAQLQRLNEVLHQQKAQLEAANRELEAFSYSASHDLRNPLGAIEGLSSLLLLRSGSVLDEPGKNHLDLIQKSARRMRRLIDDLMSLARVNRSQLQLVDVDVGTLARDILTRLSMTDPQRASQFDVQERIYAVADRNLLFIALENLLGNAWKFTSKRDCAQIAVGCEERGDEVVYFVRDNGCGFDMDKAGKLFTAFERLHGASDFEGTGIGLNIVQRIIDRHRGHVWAESQVGNGATFYFTLGPVPRP